MSDDPLSDMTGGIISGPGVSFQSLTINGETFVRNADGTLRPATDEEKAALAERQAAKAVAKAARKAQQDTNAGPSISIGDVAGGDVIRITINRKD